MQVVCDHCGNTVYADYGDKGIVDEGLKRAGWRSPTADGRRRSSDVDIAADVAEELRDLGLEASDGEVSSWLAEDAACAHDDDSTPGALRKAAAWLERAEASVTPVRAEIMDRLTVSTVHRDVAWQRTAEGLLACSGHCYEQLAVCQRCGVQRTAEEHRGCGSFVQPCTQHTSAAARR